MHEVILVNMGLVTYELTGALAKIDLGLLEADDSIAATTTLDGSQGVGDLALTLEVGVHDTQNVLEALWDNERPVKHTAHT